jgi:hypothetical protein
VAFFFYGRKKTAQVSQGGFSPLYIYVAGGSALRIRRRLVLAQLNRQHPHPAQDGPVLEAVEETF